MSNPLEPQPMSNPLEPAMFESGSALHADQGDVQTHALVSIAFSLKRIADALTRQPGPENIYDIINDIRYNVRST